MRLRLRTLAVACALAAAGSALGQIAAGGLGTSVSQSGGAWSITAGTQVGGNLFHSFSAFSIPSGNSATFSGTGSVQHIIGRVTGADASSIDGLLRSTIPGADLWLINPRGVSFGPNASLDVQGSLHVSTAHYLKLGSSGRFDAANPAASMLVSAPPSAFGFLGAGAPITIHGAWLATAPGRTLSLVGGTVSISDSLLEAPSGRINVAATASAGEVAFTPGSLAADGFSSMGALAIANSELTASGTGNGGGIHLRGGEISISGSSNVFSDTLGAGRAGDVSIGATALRMSEGSWISSDSVGTGNGGNLRIAAETLTMVSGARISTNADDAGAAGRIDIDAREVALSGGAFLQSSTFGTGSAGTIAVRAGVLTMERGFIFSQAQNRSLAGGAGGNVELDVGRLEMRNGGQVNATTFGGGLGGNIRVRASGSIEISGDDGTGFVSGLVSGATGNDAGAIEVSAPLLVVDGGLIGTAAINTPFQFLHQTDAGRITVRAGRIELLNGGRIDGSTFLAGFGGAVDVSATESILIAGARDEAATDAILRAFIFRLTGLQLTDAAFALYRPYFGNFASSGIASRTVSGNAGGAVTVTAPDITVRAGGVISSESRAFSTRASGAAGSIGVNASRSLRLEDGGSIGTNAVTADGGNITIAAGELVYLRASEVTTSVGGGNGSGGNITIDPMFVVLDHSQIIANAVGGNGGNITIVADNFLNQQSLVQASSQLGVSGNVAIQSPRVDVSGVLRALSSDYLDAARLIRSSCAARAHAASSSFMAGLRGGLAATPQSGQEISRRVAMALGCAAD